MYAYVYNDPINNVDSSGLFLNLLAGCLISGGIELASQILIDGKGLGCADWGNVAMEAAMGCNPFSKWKKLSKVVEGAQCALGNSFVAGTLVHTEQGLKPIEEIRVGDKVLAYDERSQQSNYQPVLQTIKNTGKYEIIKLTLDNGEQLEATAGHPFYIQGKGWFAASSLKIGDALLLHNGTLLVIKEVDTSVQLDAVYNLTVANLHNYFVGRNGVLVHNAFCGSGRPPIARRNHYSSKKDAYEAAKRAGKGKEPRQDPHGHDKHPQPHYHPDIPDTTWTPRRPN